MTGLPEKIVAVHESLKEAGLPHAFGGALALAWCTGRARGTIDIDLNVFVSVEQAESVLSALPDGVQRSPKLLATLRRGAQVRLWWDKTPVDVFLNRTDYHLVVAERVRWETFMGRSLPFLSCHDLAVFKALFNRTKDWADLEECGRFCCTRVMQRRNDSSFSRRITRSIRPVARPESAAATAENPPR
jgi:hypothetical protein